MPPPTGSRPLSTVSPTSIERLLACPLRIAFEQATTGGAVAQGAPRALVGVAIHRAIGLCLGDPTLGVEAAWSRACDEMAQTGPDPRGAPSARRAFLRLQRRLPDLIEYIHEREPSELLRECVVTSPDGTMSGQVDLLILGERPAIVDHKTGSVLTEGLPRKSYQRQLAIYAWIVEGSLGVEVDEAALFSLREGIVEVDVSGPVRRSIASEAMSAMEAFNMRAPGAQPATPSAHACGVCPFIGPCDPAWEALHEGGIEGFGWGDAVRGRVRAPIVKSAGGAAAVPLNAQIGTVVGHVTVFDVPIPMVETCSVGDQVSAWRLARRSDEPVALAWREGTSNLQIDPQGEHS